jgi:hypothetical protein
LDSSLFVNTLLNLTYADARCIFLLHDLKRHELKKRYKHLLPANIAALRLKFLSAAMTSSKAPPGL